MVHIGFYVPKLLVYLHFPNLYTQSNQAISYNNIEAMSIPIE